MRRLLGPVVAGAILLAPVAATADTIRIQSTTDTVDAGLKDGLLIDAYKQAQPNDTIDYKDVGTGKALDNARAGLADVVITHAPTLEKQFVDDGFSVGLGRQIFYSDYVIVGTKADPAGALAAHPHDAVGAFADIAAAASANPQIKFISRGDKSGTNVQEQLMWALTGSGVAKARATNAPNGDTTRQEPNDGSGTEGKYPAWYLKTNAGQRDNLLQTEACNDGKGNAYAACYTLVDRGTFNKQVNDGFVTKLGIVSDKNTATAPGGANLLVNPFSAYIVNPDRISTDPKPNVTAATRFVNFLVSADFQKALESFPTAVDPAFLPDAFARADLDKAPPASALTGSTLTFAGTVNNRLPGASAPANTPVTLLKTVGSAAPVAVATGTTGADGRFSLSTTVDQTAGYALRMGTVPASSYNQLTESTQALGTVAATAPAAPAGGSGAPAGSGSGSSGSGAPSAQEIPRIDLQAPRASKVRLSRRAVRLRVSERGTVKVVIQRRAKQRFKRIQTVSATARRAGVVRIKHRALRKGRYRLVITTTDAAENIRTVKTVLKRR